MDLLGVGDARGQAIAPQPIPEGYSIRPAAGEADFRKAHGSSRTPSSSGRSGSASLRGLDGPDRAAPGFRALAPAAHGRPLRRGRGASILQLAGDAATSAGSPCAATSGTEASPGPFSSTPSRQARVHGATRSELSTDSRTGALSLYEKVGMEVSSTWRHWAIDSPLPPPGSRCGERRGHRGRDRAATRRGRWPGRCWPVEHRQAVGTSDQGLTSRDGPRLREPGAMTDHPSGETFPARIATGSSMTRPRSGSRVEVLLRGIRDATSLSAPTTPSGRRSGEPPWAGVCRRAASTS